MSEAFLHLDMNNFYASVECRERPDLDGLPVAVAGSPEKRHGVVLAKNQIAKGYGVKTGDTVWEAQLKAPGIVFLPPRFDKYDKISKRMFGICNDFTCYVEPFGPDECWLDCTQTLHMFGSGEYIADRLRERVKAELGITASVGVSFTKMFAKLGSDMKKPDGTTVITQNDFRTKVWPLATKELCGVGRHTEEKLERINIRTIGELANSDERVLKKLLGKPGVDLRRIARGEDTGDVREAVVKPDAKSIGHGLTALRDLVTRDDIAALVCYLSELVAARMRKSGVKAKGIYIGVRSTELVRESRQRVLPEALHSSTDISDACMALLDTFHDGKPLRSLDVGVFALSPADAPRQLSFFEDSGHARNEALDKAIDKLRLKYGKRSVLRACLLEQDIYTDKDVGDFLPFKR